MVPLDEITIENNIFQIQDFTSFSRRSVMYMIFCGAPGHFRGGFGNVNTALPLLNALIICGPFGA